MATEPATTGRLNEYTPAAVSAAKDQRLRVESTVLDRARHNDQEALHTIFRQFVPITEQIELVEYFGQQGFLFGVRHSFACLTERRLASLKIGRFGYVLYQDGFLEHSNSGIVLQPSKFSLYLGIAFAVIVSAAAASGLALPAFEGGLELGIPVAIGAFAIMSLIGSWLMVRLYYRLVKCGFVWIIREGVSVYTFVNRGRMARANLLYRLCVDARDRRLRSIAVPG